MKLPPDLERKVLELAGQSASREASQEAPPAKLVTPGMIAPGVWLVAFESVVEANKRDWRARSRRSGAAWKAVRKAVRLVDLAPFDHCLSRGQAVQARFVRLGGRHVDPMVNLPSALKGVEDALCYLLGTDDGGGLWIPSCDQEPGGSVGVRVELTVRSE